MTKDTAGSNLAKSFIKNGLSLLLVKILDPISSFILILLIGRYLKSYLLGVYITAYNFYLIFYMISLLGLDTFIVREIAKDKSEANKYFVNIGFIGFIVSVACFISIYFIVNLMHYSVNIKGATYLVSLVLFPNMGILLCQALFTAFEKVKFLLFAAITEGVSKVFLSFLILSSGYGINALMIVIVISKVLGLLVCLYFLFRYMGKPRLEINFAFCRKIIKKVSPIFALTGISAAILFRMDIVILSKIRQIVEVSWYGLASKIVWVGNIFIINLIFAILPIISKIFVTSIDLFEIICKKFLKYLLILILFIIIVTVLLSDKLILLFFGKEFMNSAIALRILIWLLFPLSWASFCGCILIAGNKQKLNLYALGITLGSSFVLNLILAYKWGYLGTSVAVLISIVILAISEYLFVYNQMFKLNILSIAGKPLISAAITGAFAFLFREKINQFVLLASATFIYFITLLILKTFQKEDIRLLRRWI